MADEDNSWILDLSQASLRYGRAVLTVERFTSVFGTEIGKALKRFREGELAIEDLAWVFVKHQVVQHSPSFKWQDADLAVLLPRITGAVSYPAMKAQTPEELAAELEAIEQQNQEDLKKRSELTKQWANVVSFRGISTITDKLQEIQPNFGKTFKTYTLNFDDLLANNAAFVTLPKITFDPSLVDGLSQISKTAEFTEAFSVNVGKLNNAFANYDWLTASDTFIKAARNAGFNDAADAVETTAGTVSSGGQEDLNVGALLEGLQPMFASLEKAFKESKDSTKRIILVTVASMLIIVMIQISLARFGIYLVPPTPPAKVEPTNKAEAKKPANAAQAKKAKKVKRAKKPSS